MSIMMIDGIKDYRVNRYTRKQVNEMILTKKSEINEEINLLCKCCKKEKEKENIQKKTNM